MINSINDQAVLYSTIPYLTALDYGSLLSTCKEINQHFDIQSEWKRRSPTIPSEYCKQFCLLSEIVIGKGRWCLTRMLNEVTNVSKLDTLLWIQRKLNTDKRLLLRIYKRYLFSRECPKEFRPRVRYELDCLKLGLLKKRKRIRRVHPRLRPQLILGI
mgnify:CR=1 FL=1